ncbi:MAG: sulfur carrier protein ThiS [Candidatus Omnitrophota bacterium]
MLLTINGQPCTLPDGLSLEDVIQRFAADPALIVAELNGAIIAAPLRRSQALSENDTIELIAFMGGG